MDTSFNLDTSTIQNGKQYSIPKLQSMHQDIRHAVGVLSTHCLNFASRWASELLISINEQIKSQQQPLNQNENSNRSNFLENDSIPNQSNLKSLHPDPSVQYGAYKSSLHSLSDRCILAKTHFDLKDFHRVIHCLNDVDFNTDHYAFFISSYASYLEGEQRKEEAILESNNQMEKSQVINKNLREIIDQIEKREGADPLRQDLDGFHFYIKGVCLRELNRDDKAIEALIESVNRFPFNWSAWRSLSELVVNEKIFSMVQTKLNKHWMADIFVAEVMVETTEFYNAHEILKYFDDLRFKLPQSTHILGQTALILYNLTKFDECMRVFEELLSIDPNRIELLDVYSNILYVKEQRKELSYLAHRCMELHKFRAETCCVVGNYYGMYGMHEKAILYFERALQLNSNFISSYVLMGHEYIEMRNETAAIECYRKSIDLNCRDHRGWYGLGQTYELLQMYCYAIFYYNKVCKLRPYDYRMWMALASCYRNLGNISSSIKAYERAEGIAMNHQEPNRKEVDPSYKLCVLELAKLYDLDTVGQRKKAKSQYERYVKLMGSEKEHGALSDNEIEALIKLSEMELVDGRYEEAVVYCQRIIKYGTKGKDTADRILNQIRFHQKDEAKEDVPHSYVESDDGGHGMDMVTGDGSSGQEDDNDDMEISYIS